MIEPEIAFGDLDDNAKLAEDYLKYCIQYCFDNNMDDIQFLNDKALAREKAKLKAKNDVRHFSSFCPILFCPILFTDI
jgi:aspartyl/asparaginyl-tRNA synthetase